MDRFLVGIVSCEARRAYVEAQRASWVKDCKHDLRVFMAKQDRPPLADEVFLDCDDSYAGLAEKVQEMCRWSYLAGYQLLLKIDDDVILFPTRLIFPQGHYTGWKQEPASANWCSGMAYWLSRDCMRLVGDAKLPETSVGAPAPEDRWVGSVLKEAGIVAQAAPHRAIQWIGQRRHFGGRPLPANLKAQLSGCYAAGEFMPHEFEQAYQW